MLLKWAVCCAGTPASSASGCCKQLKEFRLPKTGPRSQAATSMPSRAESYFALCTHRDLHTPFTVRALPLVGLLLSSVLQCFQTSCGALLQHKPHTLMTSRSSAHTLAVYAMMAAPVIQCIVIFLAPNNGFNLYPWCQV